MKLSERLLEIFDLRAAVDRAKISDQASDIDALGELLAAAHYAGIDIAPEHIHAHGDSILLTCGAREETLAWLLRSGFSVQATDRSHMYVHHRLSHPSLRCLVVILTAGEREVRS